MENLCEYGCGQEAHFQLKNGKWCCSSNCNSCPEKRIKSSKSLIGHIGAWNGKKHSEEDIIKMKKGMRGKKHLKARNKPKSKDHKLKIGLSNKGKIKSEEHKLKISKSRKGKNCGEKHPCFGKHQSEETKEKNRQSNLKKWNDPNSIFNSKEYRENWKKSVSIKPNKLEILIDNLLVNELNLNYIYVGDYRFWVGRKNPDFINKETKKIIEVFGEYWHSKKFRKVEKTNQEHEQDRIKYFEKYGYKSLIIWDYELKNLTNLIKKILEFNNI